MIKRLGIFCTYDSEGIVDDYIIYLLKDIKKILSHLAIVCNGNLTPEGRHKLEEITDDIFVRENTGFDMEAWRQGILRHKDNLQDYDELILFNDSFYGPFYPFTEIFDEMEQREPAADFWGITLHGKMHDYLNLCPYGYVPEHLQSYFLVIRHKMFHSPEFLYYWENAKEAKTFKEAILQHEVCFTKDFADKGFTYAVYCDTRELEKEIETHIDHSLISACRLLKDYHCPTLKKKVFLIGRTHYLQENYSDEPRKSLDYVAQNTNYDLNLIWQNLLRKQNIAMTKENLSLNYIFTDKSAPEISPQILKQTVIIAHLYYEDLMPQNIKILCNTPEEISIIVTVSSEEKKLKAQKLFQAAGRKVEVRLVSNRGRDLSALLTGCPDAFNNFKYLCFIHDKKTIRDDKSIEFGRAFSNLLWDNTLGGKNFIKNILATFESESHLGLLAPPAPYNGEYKSLFFISKYWSGACLDRTLKLAKELKIPEEFISSNYIPLAIGTVFWCRTAALKKLTDKNWKIEDFPAEPLPTDGTISHALERIFPFVAQAEGFYTGWLMTEQFAKDEVENFLHFSCEVHQITENPATNVPGTDFSFSPSPQLLFQYFSQLSILQIIKYFLQSRIPPRFWYIFSPIRSFLIKLGFKV